MKMLRIGSALLVAALAGPGAADQIVTLCASDDQPGAGVNLSAALAVGGRVTFQCGAHATILIKHTHLIAQTTEIDGAGTVVLDAGGAHAVVRLTSSSATLRLRNLTIRGARPAAAPDIAGIVSTGGGTIELIGSRIENSLNPIYTWGGTVRLTDSELADDFGIGINAPNVELIRSRLHGAGVQPVLSSGGSVVIRDTDIWGSRPSTFLNCQLRIERSRLTANGDPAASGGAMQTTCDTTILDTDLVNNRARIGGAIYLRDGARLTVRGTHFTGNEAQAEGGAIAVASPWMPARTITLRHVTFTGNRAKSGGAIHLGTAIENEMVLEGTAVLFERNSAADTGGAIAGTNAGVRLARAVFNGNGADTYGGAIALISYAPRPSIVANALLVGNVAPTGSVFRGSGIQFVNSTIADNQGPAVAFFWPTPSLANPPDWRLVRLVNTLVVGNQGGGCAGGPFSVLLRDGGRNLQFPTADCGRTVPVVDPQLDGFFVPLAAGPAHGKADPATCSSAPVNGIDVYGQARLKGGGCTIGAVEGDIEDLVSRRAGSRERRIRRDLAPDGRTTPARPPPPTPVGIW
ncbi:MAG: right-handed parallel beta-helix repeat-containing protein [Acidobacteriota bacterium]